MVCRQGLSEAIPSARLLYETHSRSPPTHDRYAIALLSAPIGGIFNSSGDLFSVFGVASSTHINETKVQQPLVNPN